MSRNKYYIKVNIPVVLVGLSIVFLCLHYVLFTRCSYDKQNDDIVKNKSKIRLVVMILTSPENLERRNAIRHTWLSEERATVKYLFVIGTMELAAGQKDTLDSEQQKFHDLLLLPKLQDVYGVLTKKVLYGLKEIYDRYDFDFLFKSDDDTFVILDKILRDLDQWQNKGTKKELYWGFFNGRAQVKRTGPWKETDWVLCDYYLPYALGGGYVISYNLVKFIATNMDFLKLFNSEDVSVGVWLAPVANIERKHDVRFDTEYRSRGCSNQYFVTHKQTVGSMKNMYDTYQSLGTLCVKETRNRMSYRYNWTVPPSQCCIRHAGIP